MQFVDKAFARRLESCEEMPQVLYARAFQKTRPEIGAAEEEICGGHMIFAGLGSPIGRATGVGLDRPFTPENLDRVEEFYHDHKAPSQVDLCPLHEAAVFEMFKERGYAVAELNNVLYRKLDRAETFPPAPVGCEIRRSPIEEAEATGAIVESAFFPEGAPEAFRGLITPLYQMDRALAFVASVDDKLVACGAQSLCAVWSRDAGRIPWTRAADCTVTSAYGCGQRGRMRVYGGSYEWRNNLTTQRGTARVSCRV